MSESIFYKFSWVPEMFAQIWDKFFTINIFGDSDLHLTFGQLLLGSFAIFFIAGIVHSFMRKTE